MNRNAVLVAALLTFQFLSMTVISPSVSSSPIEGSMPTVSTAVNGPWAIYRLSYENSTPQTCSLALDSNGCVHISYYDGDAVFYTTNALGTWTTTEIDHVGFCSVSGGASSIAVDSNNKVHIAYTDHTNDDLRYATNAGGSWTTVTVASEGKIGNSPTLAIDLNFKIHIICYDYSSDEAGGSLNYFTNAGGSWSSTIIDTDAYIGKHSSMSLDHDGNAYVVYYTITYSGGYSQNLMYATNSGGSWTITALERSRQAGWSASMAMDSNDKTHISYYDGSSRNLQYMTNAQGGWSKSTVDSNITAGAYSSIAIDSNDKVHIAYYLGVDSSIKYATNSNGNWACSLADPVSGGYDCPSLALDTSGKAYIAHYDIQSGQLIYVTNSITAPSVPGDLQVTAGTSQVTLSWNIPSSNGGDETDHYSVYVDGTIWPGELLSTNALITGLVGGMTYNFSVAASNSFFDSGPGAEVSCTLYVLPGKPIDLNVTQFDGKVTLTWAAPFKDGGAPIDYYIIFQNEVDVQHVNNTSVLIDNLKTGETYDFTVAAHTLAGSGPQTTTVTVSLASSTTDSTTYLIAGALSVVSIGAIAALLFIRKRGKMRGG
jgi:hypothetical protein